MTPDVPLPGTYHAKTLLSQQVNFLSEPVMMHDTGEWCACQPCKDLIEKKEWKLLLERAANGVRDMEGLLDLPNRLQSIQELWTEVFGEEIK
jgi:hypothetical protein